MSLPQARTQKLTVTVARSVRKSTGWTGRCSPTGRAGTFDPQIKNEN